MIFSYVFPNYLLPTSPATLFVALLVLSVYAAVPAIYQHLTLSMLLCISHSFVNLKEHFQPKFHNVQNN